MTLCNPSDSTVVALRNSVDGNVYGLIPKTQISGETAAVLRYRRFARVIASLVRRALKLPRVGYFEDSGMVSPIEIMDEHSDVFVETRFSAFSRNEKNPMPARKSSFSA